MSFSETNTIKKNMIKTLRRATFEVKKTIHINRLLKLSELSADRLAMESEKISPKEMHEMHMALTELNKTFDNLSQG